MVACGHRLFTGKGNNNSGVLLCSVLMPFLLFQIVITVALGFDSYVAMRHGINRCRSADSVDSSNSSNSVESSNSSNNNKPSCYFCHDVIGPSDVSAAFHLLKQLTTGQKLTN